MKISEITKIYDDYFDAQNKANRSLLFFIAESYGVYISIFYFYNYKHSVSVYKNSILENPINNEN